MHSQNIRNHLFLSFRPTGGILLYRQLEDPSLLVGMTSWGFAKTSLLTNYYLPLAELGVSAPVKEEG
jgi:hypothetical protein